ncbi:MAG TPA: DUF4160 domain-containing protein [Dyella sp.]|uniref:DUF4160 domain-containing protein n=1 Tax=Dyella sp. TaxID=1869338 RepID=UPI002B8CFF63|nr:DUF4160 domain-containing protein [Dyella sp.]HUB88614.1 DUF4160 domain-containing protein [Dyella sp.]
MGDLEVLAKKLQGRLAVSDSFAVPRRSGEVSAGLMVMKLQDVKVKMYQERGHDKPHIHVDVGKGSHNASFSIDPAVLQAGTLDVRRTKVILNFLTENKENLLKIWEKLQSGDDARELIAAVQGN